MSHMRWHQLNRHLKLKVGTDSTSGITQKHKPNEVCLFAIEGIQTYDAHLQPFGVFVIAESIGGRTYGQEASSTAIRVMSSSLVPSMLGNAELGQEALLELLMNGAQRTNGAICWYNQQEWMNVRTMINSVLVVGSTAYVANVNDSRTYLYREPNGLRHLTHDHSVVVRLLETGMIDLAGSNTYPKRNHLSHCIGERVPAAIDIFTVLLQEGDKLLLCSDGLWKMVDPSEIEQMMSAPVADPSQTAKALIQAALDGGYKDNASVIVVCIS